MDKKSHSQYKDWVSRTVHYEMKQQLGLIMVLLLGMFLYLLTGTALLVVSQIYPLVVSGLVIGFVWRIVKIHNEGFDKSSERTIEDASLNTLERVGLFARRNLIGVVLSGYVAIAYSFAIAFHATGTSSAPTLAENFYFSIVTLATVGYGDFAPTGWGKMLAVSEVLMGLAYQLLAFGSAVTFFGRYRR